MFGLNPYRRNTQMSYRPFQDMEDMERRFFEEPFGSFFRNEDIAEFKTDIKDNGDSFLLEADLPGFKKEDIHLDINGDVLTVRAERHSEYEDNDKKGNYVRCERSWGQYSRSFDLSSVDKENLKAKLDEGVLKVTLPKKQKESPAHRTLEIE